MKNSSFEKTSKPVHIELKKLVDHNHPLVQLNDLISWTNLELAFRPAEQEPSRTRLMLALHYLRHTYELSDIEVLKRTGINPYYQYFCGFEYFSTDTGVSPEDMKRWRTGLGPEWSVELLVAAMESELRPEMIAYELNPELKTAS